MAETSYKRKNYLIKRNFQLKYTLAMVAVLFLVMAASFIGLYMGMWGSIIQNFSKFEVSQNLENVRRITDYEEARYRKGDSRLDKIFREAELLSMKQKETLKTALVLVNRSLMPKVIILAAFIFLAGIVLSHRIAGPIYRIEKTAEAMRGGNLTASFAVRKGDEMKAATSALEEMAASLREDMGKIKSAASELEAKVNAIKSCVNEEDFIVMKDAVKNISAVVSRYRV